MILLGLSGLVAALPLAVNNPYYLNVLNILGLNAIMVIGLNLLIGYAGQISLGHAAFFALGAYLSGILTTRYNLPPWPTIFLAMAVTGLVAWIIGLPTMRLSGNYLVMATLGFNVIVNIVINQWDALTGGPSGLPGIPALKLGTLTLDTDLRAYYLIWTTAVLAVLAAMNLTRSRVGRALQALHASETAAGSAGVNVAGHKVKVFILSACLASLAGSLYAHYLSFISPKTFNIFFSVELVTMVMIGGLGSIWAGLLGAAVLTPLPHLLHFFEEYKDLSYGLILVVILIFLPEGLLVGLNRRLANLKNARTKSGGA